MAIRLPSRSAIRYSRHVYKTHFVLSVRAALVLKTSSKQQLSRWWLRLLTFIYCQSVLWPWANGMPDDCVTLAQSENWTSAWVQEATGWCDVAEFTLIKQNKIILSSRSALIWELTTERHLLWVNQSASPRSASSLIISIGKDCGT